MRSLLAGSLGLSLACWAGTARADDLPVRLDRPRPAAVLLAPTTAPAPSSAALARPVSADAALRRALFADSRADAPVVRAQGIEMPQPLPVGPTGNLDLPARPGRPAAPVIIARRQKDTPAAESVPVMPTPVGPVMPSAPPPGIWGFAGGPIEGPAALSAGCGPECGPGLCGDCCQPPRFWLGAEYLLWGIKDANGPPLVTTGNGAFGPGTLPGATVLYSGDDMHYQLRSGARFYGGWWFGDERSIGLDTSFLFLGDRNANFMATSGLGMSVFRPFIGVDMFGLQTPRAEEAARITVHSTSRLYGGDVNLRFNLNNGSSPALFGGAGLGTWLPRLGSWGAPVESAACEGAFCCPAPACAVPSWCCRWDFLTGFRYLALEENLTIMETALRDGVTFNEIDSFNTQNYFYGGQVGSQLELTRGRFFVDFVGKVALGTTRQIVTINGMTSRFAPTEMPMVQTAMGGLLTQPTNIGRRTHDSFAVVPELGVKLGWQVTDYLRLTVGYTFLYWSKVARPGDQIDPVVNTAQQATFVNGRFINPQPVFPARPAPDIRESDFWAHGVNFGLEFRY